MLPLSIAPINVVLKIKRIVVQGKQKNFLESLGFGMDMTITAIENINGNLIVILKNVRMALDSNIASKIFVEEGKEEV